MIFLSFATNPRDYKLLLYQSSSFEVSCKLISRKYLLLIKIEN